MKHLWGFESSLDADLNKIIKIGLILRFGLYYKI
jgi:hypothetical protein